MSAEGPAPPLRLLGVVGATDSDGRRDLHAALVRRHGAGSGLILTPAAPGRPAAPAAPAAASGGEGSEPWWLAGRPGLRIYDPDVGFEMEADGPGGTEDSE